MAGRRHHRGDQPQRLAGREHHRGRPRRSRAGAECRITGTSDPSGEIRPVTFPYTLVADGTEVFAYSCSFTGKPAYDGTNTATVTWDAEAAHTANGSADGTAALATADWTVHPFDDTVTVTDDHFTFDPVWVVDLADGAQTRSYEVTWNVGTAGTCEVFTNTASIDGDDGFTAETSADAEACRLADLTGDIDASGDFIRTYGWSIDKLLAEGQADSVIASPDGTATIGYVVEADVTGHTDSGWTVSGQVGLGNPNDFVGVRTTLTADIAGATCTVDEAADVDAAKPGVQIDLPADGSATVDFDCVLASLDAPVTVTATAAWDGGETTLESGEIDFGYTTVNEYVGVFDDHGDPEGEPSLIDIISVDDAPTRFEYEVGFSGLEAGCEVVTNTAWIEALVEVDEVAADDAPARLAQDTADVTICPPNAP
ncbi:hypothetical protein G7085_08585 [Tessaracoccus sp. HDW20]|uniref:hypothetical protein n=1 Tax=Tessaracoccus coleopterorum TaxID=2714950 RepID=UPI0018D3DDFA|nr:hypothetical protein [Tessaracoccus coleopterorum]NHB84647.1 hypothetical protein [Tessaracoccus coleopterorum]